MSNSIEQHPFIFSSERNWRLKRHITFWLFWWLSQGFLYSFIAAGRGEYYWLRLQSSMIEAFIYLVPHVFLSYSIIYYVIPRLLLQQQYLRTAVVISILFLLTACISAFLSLTVIDFVRNAILSEKSFFVQKQNIIVVSFLAVMAGLRGAITIGGMAGCIKLMKYWYVKDWRNTQLQQQNTASQLQLLKAQVHPHFLFNTLNNIHLHSNKDNIKAAQLVKGLTSMLNYMLYETNASLVPLQKELQLIKDYIEVERIQYNNLLDVRMKVDGNIEGLYITPLILIPLVENCFKHGASKMVENPWISLHITIYDDYSMMMKLMNSKPVNGSRSSNNGVGIDNIRKRLKLIYAFQHKLDIIDDEDVFIVNLKLQLDRKHSVVKKVPKPTIEEFAEVRKN